MQTTIALHPAQHDVYTEQILKRDSPLYNVGGYISLKGPLDKAVFFKVVQSAPGFFDGFKLRFNLDAADFLAYVQDEVEELVVEELDYSQETDAVTAAINWMQNDFNIAFPINLQSVLCRQVLIKISEDEHWFYGKYHHLITDGYGFIVWVKYLADAYRLQVNNQPIDFSFPAYIPQMIEAAGKSAEYEHSATYWKEKFERLQERLLQSNTSSNGSIHLNVTRVFEIDSEQQQRLEGLKKITGTGLLQLSMAALVVYYSKFSAAAEIVFGIPIHRRNSRVLRNIVGMFSGILPFKTKAANNITVAEILADISSTFKEDLKHQHFILGDLMRGLNTNSSGSLYDIIINYEPFNFQLDFGNEIKAGIYQLSGSEARSPLQFTWQVHGPQQPLQLQIDYSINYFSDQQIDYLKDSFFFILDQLKNTDLNVDSIKTLGTAENAFLTGLNLPAVTMNKGNVVKWFEEQTRLRENEVCLYTADIKYTYQQLNERSNQVAHNLLQMGVRPESLVPLCIERGFNMVAGMLGILKAGAAYVPIDPAYPADRIAYMLADSNATFVLTSQNSSNHLPATSPVQMVQIDDPLVFQHTSLSNPNIELKDDQLAYVIYTSGSTGTPKGVMIEHQNLSAFLHWCKQEFAADKYELVYASTSICFDLSVFEIFFPLCIGKPIRIIEHGLEASKYLPGDKKVLVNTVPVVIDSLLKEKVSFENVAVLNMAGEPIPIHVLMGLDTDQIVVRNLYGPTEDTTYSTVYRLHKDQPILIGKPIANTQIHLLSQKNERVPFGAQGEICVAGAGIARGYLNQEELTNEKFVAHPFSTDPAARLYKTGDLGRWTADGNLEYLGRIDNQVKIRGFRIEPGEIEHVLQLSGCVQNVAVVVKEDTEGNKMLVAYFVASDNIKPDKLKGIVQQKLPAYMVPAAWVQLEQLPLTANGKIDRKALPAPGNPVATSRGYEEPATSTEKQVAGIWQQVLSVDRVGRSDNFFEMGGHSIKAIQVITRLHQQMQVRIEFSQFMAHPTLQQFCHLIDLQHTTSFSSIPKAEAKTLYRLSNAQKRIYVLCQLKGGLSSFNSPALFELHGNFNTDVLEKAIQYIIDRHETLRTVFVEENGEPMQKIRSTAGLHFSIPFIDLSTDNGGGERIGELLKQEVNVEFDLKNGPLFQVLLVKQSEDKHLLLFNIHHIISDGWSKGILINEFLDIWAKLVNSEEVTRNLSAPQYKDYAEWQPGAVTKQQAYWRTVLSGQLPVLQFPLDHTRPRVVTFSGELLQYTIGKEVTEKLSAFALTRQMTLNHLILALYGMLVSHHSNQQNVIIGSMVSGRSHVDLEQMVGLFINFLPIPLNTNRSQTLGEYLHQSRETLLGAYAHQDYPFDLMVNNFLRERDFSRNPFFDTMVNFHSENELGEAYEVQDRKHGSVISVKLSDNFREHLFQSNLDFKLDVEMVSQTLLLNLGFNVNLFSRQRMHTFLLQFAELLSQVVGQTEASVGDYLPWPVQDGVAQTQESTPLTPTAVQETPVYICTSFVAEPLQEYVEYWSAEYQLDLAVRFAPYNQVLMQLLDKQSSLNNNNGINILFVRVQDWLRDQRINDADQVTRYLDQTLKEFEEALEFSASNNSVATIIGIVPINPQVEVSEQVAQHITLLNQQLHSFLVKQPHIDIINLNHVAELYEVEEMFDTKSDEMGHIPFTQEYFAALGTFLARKIRSYKSKAYKVLALDCDNTLWKGICGEIGCMNVEVDNSFSYLQRFLLRKHSEGFLLVLCSKNNEEDVWEVFEQNAGMLLKKEHIAAHRINWDDKPGNLASIAKELNLGLDSFIFIDDNPFETGQMNEAFPEVLTLLLPAEEEVKSFLDHTWEFDVFKITDEDTRRNAMYRVEKERRQEQQKHGSLDDFMRSLQVEVFIRPIEEKDIERAVQLSLRTNQFNMNGIRLPGETLVENSKRPNAFQWIIDVKDRFGDYGTVGLVSGQIENGALTLHTFLLSCRVLGRGVEEQILAHIKQYCKEQKVFKLCAMYKSTPKNKPFERFLHDSGWKLDIVSDSYTLEIKYSSEEITT